MVNNELLTLREHVDKYLPKLPSLGSSNCIKQIFITKANNKNSAEISLYLQFDNKSFTHCCVVNQKVMSTKITKIIQ